MLPLLSWIAFTIGCLSIIAYCWAVYRNGYWHRHGMPCAPAVPFIGSFRDLMTGRKSIADIFRDYYNLYPSVAVCGFQMFHTPALFIRDPELVKQVLIKDFLWFSERYTRADKHDVLGASNLFFARYDLWRRVRVRLTPFFTSGKLRKMYPLVNDVAETMNRRLVSMPLDDPVKKSFVSETRDFAARYTTDVIASCAFGVQANSINDPESEFRRNGRKVFEASGIRTLELIAMFFMPALMELFKFKAFAAQPEKFIRDTINYVMKERELSKERRNDLIDTLLDIKKETDSTPPDGDIPLRGDVLVAQAGIFFTAGFETSSSTISFALYELAKDSAVQTRLRQEIKEALEKTNGKIDYETIMSMEYMHMVISEILRLHPILPFLDRTCTPIDNETGYSLEPFHDFVVPKNMPIIIPIAAIQRDPKYFPNPDHFDPERFSPANKHKILPYTFMPFGLGPHNCVGERFGWIQSKLGLVNILKNHYLTPTDTMPKNIFYAPKSLFLQTVDGLYVNMVRDPLI